MFAGIRLPLIILFGFLIINTARGDISEQQKLVDQAFHTLDGFLKEDKQTELPIYLQNAYAVLILPDVLRGGFIIGAEHGYGVLLARNVHTGVWTQPAFIEIYGGSFGLQIGGQTSEMVFTIMNQSAIEKLLSSRFKIGADASVAFGRLGAGVGAGTTVQLGEDIYAFARNRGLFGGVALDGSVVVPLDDWNTAFYGTSVTTTAILAAQVPQNSGTDPLRQLLTRY
ncbi:MAG: lipid-binding SYLF domain-containing protein [Pseudomonadota bacterium]